jgi:DHA1 family multidrug resistance protein-like MFS transporter
MEFFRAYPNVLIICIGVFIAMLGFGMIFPLFPLFAEQFGATAAQIGLITSIFALARTVLATPFGAISDRYGRKRLIITGFIFYAVVMSAFAFSQSVTHLFLFRGLQGVASAMVWPSAQAIIADSTRPQDRGRAMAYFSAAWQVSLIVSPAFGGFLAELYDYRIPFLAAGAVMVPISILIHRYVTETIRGTITIISAPEPFMRRFKSGVREIRESTYFITLMGLLTATFISTFGLMLINPLVPLYAQSRVGATVLQITLIYTLMGVAGTVTRIYAGKIIDRMGRKVPIVFGNIWAALLTFPMMIIQTPLQMIGVLAARSGGLGLSDPATQTLLSDLVDENKRGKIFGLYTMVSGIALILGPSVGGTLYEIYGGEISFGICGILTLVASLILYFMITEPSA